MKISIISASHRTNSQSKKISDILLNNLLNIKSDIDMYDIDLGEKRLPLWSPDKKNGKGVWGSAWNSISDNLKQSDGFILIVPEYGGMATPAAKNVFLLCGNGEFAHKPGLIVSVSSGNGGAYPIAELRMSSYKNTHIMWIPENIIIMVSELRCHEEGCPDVETVIALMHDGAAPEKVKIYKPMAELNLEEIKSHRPI